MSRNVVEVLTEARALLARRGGWGKGDYEPKPGVYCLLGAVNFVETGQSNRSSYIAYRYLRAAGVDFGDARWIGLDDWNDAPARRKREVLKLYDRAIELAKAASA
jgi:hypothetical protein